MHVRERMCVCWRIYVWVCVCMRACVWERACVCVGEYVCESLCVCEHVSVCERESMCAYWRVCVYVSVIVCECVHPPPLCPLGNMLAAWFASSLFSPFIYRQIIVSTLKNWYNLKINECFMKMWSQMNVSVYTHPNFPHVSFSFTAVLCECSALLSELTLCACRDAVVYLYPSVSIRFSSQHCHGTQFLLFPPLLYGEVDGVLAGGQVMWLGAPLATPIDFSQHPLILFNC